MTPYLRRSFLCLALCAGYLWAAGCGANLGPLLVPQTDLGSGQVYSLQDVENAVLLALADKGWMVVDRQPGQIVAEISRQEHHAKISVRYNEAGWVIEHVETSEGLLYQPGGNGPLIHKRYNLWVSTLDREIRAHLSQSLTAGSAAPPAAQPAPAQPAAPAQSAEPAAPSQADPQPDEAPASPTP